MVNQMLYSGAQLPLGVKAAANIILATILFLVCVSAEIAWGQDYKVKHLQSKLTLSGFDPGPIDGFWGKRTASALTEMLNENGIKLTSVTKSDISNENLLSIYT